MRTGTLPIILFALAACASHTTPPAPPAPPVEQPPATIDGHPHFSQFSMNDRGALALPSPIVFAAGTADLDEAASAQPLWYIHDYLEAKPDVTMVRIEGHGTESGEDALMMTGDRALNVARWLVAHGIKCDRMIAAAFGDTKPIADPSTPDGKAQNRRIDVYNVALRGTLIANLPADGTAPAAVPVCD
ncbi:MAG TPA: OmpA family protein [Kofleriaceae bacterium]|nr:OmpA family protein [Kofleriaceae bacterium]